MVTSSQTPRVLGQDNRLSLWNFSVGKRAFDAVSAAVGLALTLPLMALIAVAVKLSSSGPILFRQPRVGKDGEVFEILKFRTMLVRKQNPGSGLTREGDARVTTVGRVLRLFKLDELPQLFNVLRGDMSLVGPRPDLPEFCNAFAPQHRLVLTLRPGITGWATLHYRNEEKVLACVPAEQMASFYVKSILPAKAHLDLAYAQEATFLSDVGIVLRTLIGV